EMSSSGESRIVWSSHPSVRLDELRPIPEAKVDPAAFEVVHMNAIDVAENDPTVVVTCRELEQVLGVDRTTGAVRWRLGGKEGTLRVVGDAMGSVSAVHGARILPGHRLRIFDNGNSRKVPESRI